MDSLTERGSLMLVKSGLVVALISISFPLHPAMAQEAPPLSARTASSATGMSIDGPESDQPGAIDPTKPTPIPPVSSSATSEWVVAPIPSHSPSQEWALGLVAQYIFRPAGTNSANPPSIIGGGGFITQESSYGGGLGYLGHLDDDRWRVAVVAGYGQINYDFYGIGNAAALQNNPIHIEQETSGILLQVIRRIAPNLYLGPRLNRRDIDATARTSSSVVRLPPFEAEAETVSLGGKLQWDTRDNTFYPTTGNLLNATIDVFTELLGSDFAYRAYELEYNHYLSLNSETVLALRGYGRYVDGDVPFFDLSMFGRRGDLRGYESGKYRDNFMIATQGEIRYRINDWLGLAAFAGVGEVAPDPASLTADDLLWSIGGGIRFRIARQNPINFRIDIAQGTDDTAFYISVGEAF